MRAGRSKGGVGASTQSDAPTDTEPDLFDEFLRWLEGLSEAAPEVAGGLALGDLLLMVAAVALPVGLVVLGYQVYQETAGQNSYGLPGYAHGRYDPDSSYLQARTLRKRAMEQEIAAETRGWGPPDGLNEFRQEHGSPPTQPRLPGMEPRPSQPTLPGMGAGSGGGGRPPVAAGGECSGGGASERKLGGAHNDVPANGGENHHMPANSVSPFSKDRGPVLNMTIADHRATESWGSFAEAQAYRDVQAALIQDGLFKEAQQMDIDNVRALFGTKYDEGIRQMLEYTDRLLSGEC
jgi:hypothetical protein